VVDEAVYRSERDTGHRNRAIGHLLRNFDIITNAPEPALQLYFRQCSVTVTCVDLAVMASTLASQGRNPLTGIRVIEPGITTNVLAVMGSCGMYDYTGQWLYNVGMPSKSGVGGGVMAVIPGRLGLAVYSPPLDSYGNSVRGIAVCEWISQQLELHLFNQPPICGTTIRSATDGATRHSRRWRNSVERQRLDLHGHRIKVIQAQGVLDFAATEELLAEIQSRCTVGSFLVLDLARVITLPEVSARLIRQQFSALSWPAARPLLCNGGHLPDLWPQTEMVSNPVPPVSWFHNLDEALEQAEDLLLADLESTQALAPEVCPLGLLERLPEDSRRLLEPLLQRRHFDEGAAVCRLGEPGGELFLIESGRFTAMLQPSEQHAAVRLATFSAGACFGEVAFLGNTPRSADVIADRGGTCLVLTRARLEELERDHPRVVIDLMRALHTDLASKLELTSRQLSLLEAG
jgi:glutaminase